jgi:hypothetical protein
MNNKYGKKPSAIEMVAYLVSAYPYYRDKSMEELRSDPMVLVISSASGESAVSVAALIKGAVNEQRNSGI